MLLVGIQTDGTSVACGYSATVKRPGSATRLKTGAATGLQFTGRSLGDPPAARWAVQADGGEFDQFTGATITPRAVVTGAVRRALEYYQRYQASSCSTRPRDALLEAR